MSPRERDIEREFEERVIEIDRVSRTVKGGKRMRFRALMVVGNRNGKVGMGLGKAGDVQTAIKKGVQHAKKQLIDVPIVNDTIPHETTHKYGSAVVYLKPAAPGTSIIAGGPVRAVIELAGIKNILSKIIGSNNKINNVRAVLATLEAMNETGKPAIEAHAAKKQNQSSAKKPKTATKPRTTRAVSVGGKKGK